MPSASLDEIAVALAVGGVGLGFFSAGRRSVNSMSLIGAALGVAGAFWLTMSMVRQGGPMELQSPAWLGPWKNVASNAVVCLLAIHALIVATVCCWEFRALVDVESSDRLWISAPIVVSSVVLFQDPVAIAGAYLTANVVVATVLGSAGPTLGLFRMVGALAFVAAILCSLSKGPLVVEGHAEWSIDLSKNWPLVLLGASTVVPLICPVEVRGGRAQRAYAVAAPFFLLAALIVDIGVSPFGHRLSAVVSLSAVAVAVWHGWRAFKAPRRTEVTQRVASSFVSLAVYYWLNSSSVTSSLAFCAATSAASVALFMALEGSLEGRGVHWSVWLTTIVAACGATAALGCLFADILDRAIASPASWFGAAVWISFAFALAAATLVFASIRHPLGGLQESEGRDGGDFSAEATAVSMIALLSGVLTAYPLMFGDVSPGSAALSKLFGLHVEIQQHPLDAFAVGIGLTASLFALAVGVALPHRTTASHPEIQQPGQALVRLIASPLVVFEWAVEVLFASAYQILAPRSNEMEKRVPSPAAIVFVAAVAACAALLIVQRSGGIAP